MTPRRRNPGISIVEQPAEDVPPVGPDEPTAPYTPTPSESPRRPGRPRGTRTATPRPSGGSSPSRRAAGPDYAGAIRGLGQVVAGGLALAQQPLDAWAFATYTPPIAQAMHDLALAQPAVAAVLDKVLAVGPYGAVIAAGLPLIVQLLHNHKMIPAAAAESLGAVNRDLLLAQLTAAGEAMAGDAAA